jgi:hypothetical protein
MMCLGVDNASQTCADAWARCCAFSLIVGNRSHAGIRDGQHIVLLQCFKLKALIYVANVSERGHF